MAGFNFGYPSDDEIWEKISSDDINSRVEGLLDAGRKVGFVDGNPAQAMNYLETARELADSLNDFTGLAHSYHLMGAMYWRQRKFADCAGAHEAGADAGKRSFRADLEIDHLAFAARAYLQLGDVAAVRRNFELAISLSVESESRTIAMLYGEYGRFLRKQGDVVSARKYLELAVDSEDEYQWALASSELVTLLLQVGEPGRALEVAREIYSLAEYNEDERMKNKASFGIAKALLGMGNASAALDSVNALDLNQFTSVKHKVRFDLIRASALVGLEREEEALKIYARAIPMLRKLKLWDTLGSALSDRAFLHWEMENRLDCEEDTIAAISAYEKAGNAEEVSRAQLGLADLLSKKGDWTGVEYYSGLVIDNVLQMFATWYPSALALCALAKAKLGKNDEALELASRLFESKNLVSCVAAQGYHAQAIVIGGVKGKNLAVKAMKGYLEFGYHELARDASSLA